MDLISDIFKKCDRADIGRFDLREDEYIKDNMIYCKKCDTPRTCNVDFFGRNTIQRCVCDCQKAANEEEKIQDELRQKMLRLERLHVNSLMGDKYKNVRFSNTVVSHNKSYKIAYERCKKFCENSKDVVKEGYGIYIYGNAGCGKTHLTACMANELMGKYTSVIFTNFFEISRKIRETYNSSRGETEEQIKNRLKEVEVLFIDDLGTESLAKNNGDNFLQDLMFEVINSRYNENKSTIFTSNYSLQELVIDRKFEEKTVDRIRELSSAIIYIDGESYRGRKVQQQQIPF